MIQEHEPRWRRVVGRLPVLIALASLYGLIIVSIVVEDMVRGSEGKVGLWEWVGVLIIPVALTAGGIWLNNAQIRREEKIAIQRAQDEALQVYLSQMNELVVDKGLRAQPKGSDIRRIAQARTIALLLGLDASRKRRSLKLVYELGLIDKSVPILSFKNAALDNADLNELALPDACLSHVDLRVSNLSGSNLSRSDLSKADLRGANLSNVDLSGADLTEANLLPYDKQQPAKMSIHNLKDKDVDSREAYLRTSVRSRLTPTTLSNTNLAGADLRGAILANSDLRTTRGLTEEQLEQAIGNQRTLLPRGLEYPEAWMRPIDEQIEMRDKRKEENLSSVNPFTPADQSAKRGEKRPNVDLEGYPEVNDRRKMLQVLQDEINKHPDGDYWISLYPEDLARMLESNTEGKVSAPQKARAVALFNHLVEEQYVHDEPEPSKTPAEDAPTDEASEDFQFRPLHFHALTDKGLRYIGEMGLSELTRRQAMLKVLQEKRRSDLNSFEEPRNGGWQTKLTVENLTEFAKGAAVEQLTPKERKTLKDLTPTKVRRLYKSLLREGYLKGDLIQLN